MSKPWNILHLALLCFVQIAFGQFRDAQIKVYDFDDGLSHRNTFKINQDSSGYIWIATINGLNRFDGYDFTLFNANSRNRIPATLINDLHIDNNNKIWLASLDFLTTLDPLTHQVDTIWIKDGNFVRRESKVPNNLFLDNQNNIWASVYDEKTAETQIYYQQTEGIVNKVLSVDGQYLKRPILQKEDFVYAGSYENELLQLRTDASIHDRFYLKHPSLDPSESRIVQLQVARDTLWVLSLDGQLFSLNEKTGVFTPHPVNKKIKRKSRKTTANAFLVEENGDIWIGGQSVLWHYDALTNAIFNFDQSVRQIIKNACNYRQIFKDRSDAIWIASDFGAIKIVQSDHLFTNYLNGGSEYCSNIYCSTRGITEDEKGNIYISYYNSIHVLDPTTDNLQLLFPANDYFNYPFGLLYHENALWTGNGRRIDIRTLKVDTLFNKPNTDLGSIMVDSSQMMWFGFQHWLYRYDPQTRILQEFEDNKGKWDSTDGRISFLYQGKTNDFIWIGTLENGLYKLDSALNRVDHYHIGAESPVKLNHNQINTTYEDQNGFLWIGTGNGLHRLDINNDSLTVFTTENDLPNSFINGILPEGDSVLWISTDHGLCRFRINQVDCTNFFQQNGLSANEFNRISFYKSNDGRMYFGGLDGLNAFYPSNRFLEDTEDTYDLPLLFTAFNKLDGLNDSLHHVIHGIQSGDTIRLGFQDKTFSLRFALASFKQPHETEFSYQLEGYENNWSPPSKLNLARYSNIPAGTYTFRVKARKGLDEWNKRQLMLTVIVEEAYYNTLWFRILTTILGLGAILGFMRYRFYLSQKRQEELERVVKERTLELEKEKQKSEELLLNILPAETAEELKKYGAAKAKRYELVTVMFSDFKGFTKISELLEPEELVAEIDLCFRAFDEIIDKHQLEKIKTVGDAYMCVGGISSSDTDEAIRVVKAALEIQEFLHAIQVEKKLLRKPFFEARIGIHTGPVVAGIVGIKKFAYDIWGDTVNIASRMETNGEAGQVNISKHTFEMIKQQFRCNFHGKYKDRDKHDIDMYFVEEYIRKTYPTIPTGRKHSV